MNLLDDILHAIDDLPGPLPGIAYAVLVVGGSLLMITALVGPALYLVSIGK